MEALSMSRFTCTSLRKMLKEEKKIAKGEEELSFKNEVQEEVKFELTSPFKVKGNSSRGTV
ncbi:hypothetical protein HMI54_008077 [Coelomomyces lativittatus]|nr:hypothetical protein HMI54_008077 [Coelomomyces lativittatus]